MNIPSDSLDFQQAHRDHLDKGLKLHGIVPEELDRLVEEVAAGRPAYAAGSMVEGLANQYSDLDVFIVCDDNEPLRIEITNLKSLRVDFEWWPRSRLTDISCIFKDARDLSAVLDVHPTRLLVTAHRILNCIPLTHTEAIRLIQSNFSRAQLAIYMLRYWIGNCENDLQDAIGAYCTGDLEYAWERATTGIGHSLDLLVASNGSTNPDSKYRVKLLHQFVPHSSEMMGIYRGFHSEWPTLREATANGIAARINFIKHIVYPIARMLSESLQCTYSKIHTMHAKTADALEAAFVSEDSMPVVLEDSLPVACLSTRHCYARGNLILLTYEKGFPKERQHALSWWSARACELANGENTVRSIGHQIAQLTSSSEETALAMVKKTFSYAVDRGFYEFKTDSLLSSRGASTDLSSVFG